jgi:restriction system protein
MIPDYQTLMLPFLRLLSDEKEHLRKEVQNDLAKIMSLSDDELNILLPNTKVSVFRHRVGWTRTYLKKAGLIEYVRRGVYKITDRGKKVLAENPKRITVSYLKQFPEILEFLKGNKTDKDELQNSIEISDDKLLNETPQELIANGYKKIRKSLEEDLLEKLKIVSPKFFEEVVVELLVKMGYGGSIAEAGKATRYTNDEGIDGIIKEDKLGLDVIYIQAKRWEGTVSRPEIQKFVGALAGQRAKKGVFITTSNFSKEATAYATQMDAKIVLIDGEQLAQYMIDYNLGVSVQNVYEIKKMDSDYFEED